MTQRPHAPGSSCVSSATCGTKSVATNTHEASLAPGHVVGDSQHRVRWLEPFQGVLNDLTPRLHHADPAFRQGLLRKTPGHKKPRIVFKFTSYPSFNHDKQVPTYMHVLILALICAVFDTNMCQFGTNIRRVNTNMCRFWVNFRPRNPCSKFKMVAEKINTRD